MKQDEAEKLAQEVKARCAAAVAADYPSITAAYSIAPLVRLCDHVLSGAMKREIENAAYERAAQLVDDVGEEQRAYLRDPEVEGYAAARLLVCERIAEDLRALIQPPA